MATWHFDTSPLCLVPSLPSLDDEIFSPTPQVQKKAPLCRLRWHFCLWEENKSYHYQGRYWEHHALSPTGLAIVKRIKWSCLNWPWISSQLGPPPTPTPIPLPTQMPRICSRNKLKLLLLSDPQTMQIFFVFVFFFSFSLFKKRDSDCWKIPGRQLECEGLGEEGEGVISQRD